MRKLFTFCTILASTVLSYAQVQTISIRDIVNFGLSDNGRAGDGKGGFTDDGVNLGKIKYKDGVNNVFDTQIDLIDPDKNNGKAVLTFECASSKTGLRKAVIDLSDKKHKGESLVLLHSSTKSPDVRYTKIGKIQIDYKSGKKQEIILDYAIDVMNGLYPQNRSNAKIWSPTNKFAPAYFFSRFNIKNEEIKTITLSTMDIATWVVAGISIEKEFPKWTAQDKDWVKVDMSKIAIAKDSALDVSKDFENHPSGKYGRVDISKRGRFVFENRPNKRLKFHGTVWYMAGELGKTDEETKANLTELCKIVKRQGYNLLRFHTTDFLCSPDPIRVQRGFDLYDWLIAEAQKNGIYLNLLIGNNDLGAKGFKWDDRFSLKLKMIMGDPKTREDWRAHAKKQLEHVNKYTGVAWKDDPTFMGMEYWNEMDLMYVFPKIDKPTFDLANREFRNFLKEKYQTIENLNSTGRLTKKNYKSFDEITFKNEFKTSEVANLMQKKNREFGAFCEKVVKQEIGYKGLIYQFNCNRQMNTLYMSSELADYMALNVYFKHPSNFMTPPSTVGQESSLVSLAHHMREGMAHRISNRPMTFTEYNHCHWNPFKYEGGIIFGAYSAFQGFDAMVVHSDAVKTGRRPSKFMGPFGVFNSPVFRANEFLTYCLFMRGDVKRAKRSVEVYFPKDYIENNANMMNGLASEQSRIGLITGLSIDFEGAKIPEKLQGVKRKRPSVRILPVGASETKTAQNFASTGGNIGKKFDIEGFVAKLKQDGIIPADNKTSPNARIFESCNGQILMDADKFKISVITKRTEAVAFKKGVENLDALTEITSTVPCCVSVSSMDKAPISESKRLVMTYSTDNINKGSQFSTDRELLLKNANPRKTEVLILRGKMSAKLRLAKDTNYKLYALHFNGERMAEIPTSIEDGVMTINIDNSKTPTTFFEIVAE